MMTFRRRILPLLCVVGLCAAGWAEGADPDDLGRLSQELEERVKQLESLFDERERSTEGGRELERDTREDRQSVKKSQTKRVVVTVDENGRKVQAWENGEPVAPGMHAGAIDAHDLRKLLEEHGLDLGDLDLGDLDLGGMLRDGGSAKKSSKSSSRMVVTDDGSGKKRIQAWKDGKPVDPAEMELEIDIDLEELLREHAPSLKRESRQRERGEQAEPRLRKERGPRKLRLFSTAGEEAEDEVEDRDAGQRDLRARLDRLEQMLLQLEREVSER